ncbi:hypothetical protein [Rhodocista pekingensis]|uniref:O-antigen ligase domain-containing protein n=1 Tax=Rhodocista pekingensis TaxID=201185 RepID=A0ABW2KYP7_9PROT
MATLAERQGGDGAALRLAALVGAIVVYGVAGAPAPASVGPAELAVGLGLLVAVGLRAPLWLGTGYLLRCPGATPAEIVACLCLPLLLWLPLVRGSLMGWQPTDIVRDVVPLGFLFLPLLLRRGLSARRAAGSGAVADLLAAALAAAGLAFAFRWWAHVAFGFAAVGDRTLAEGDLYLLNSAAVPFAAVWLTLQGLRRLFPARGAGAVALGLVLGAAGLLCTGALAGAVHRAALGLVLGTIGLGVALRLRTAPGDWRLVPVAGAGLLAAFGWAALGALSLVAEKTGEVGWNNRAAEAGAVLRQIGRSLPAFLLGDGWGALVASPAVGNWRVSFTHNAASYFLVKTGLLGFVAATGYLAALLAESWPALRRRADIALAALPSLAVALFLHTSYKYLCFGLLCTVLLLAAAKDETPKN